MLQQFQPNSSSDQPAPPSVKGMLTIGLITFGLISIYSSFFTVPAESEALVMRFGKYTRTVSSGLRFKLPLIEQATLLPVKRQLKQEFGFLSDLDSLS